MRDQVNFSQNISVTLTRLMDKKLALIQANKEGGVAIPTIRCPGLPIGKSFKRSFSVTFNTCNNTFTGWEDQINRFATKERIKIGINFDSVIYLIVVLLQSYCPFSYASIYQSIHPFINPHILLSIHTSIYQSIHLFINPYIYLSIHTSIYQSIHLFINPYIHLSIHTSIYQSIHPLYPIRSIKQREIFEAWIMSEWTVIVIQKWHLVQLWETGLEGK